MYSGVSTAGQTFEFKSGTAELRQVYDKFPTKSVSPRMLKNKSTIKMKAITLSRPFIDNSNAEIYFLKLGTVFIALRGRSSRKALSGRKLIPATGKN